MSLNPSTYLTVTPHSSFKAIPEHSSLELPNITPTPTPLVIGPQYPEDTDPAPLSAYFVSNRPSCATSKSDCWYLDIINKTPQIARDIFGSDHNSERFDFVCAVSDISKLDSISLVNAVTQDRYTVPLDSLITDTTIQGLGLTANDDFIYIYNAHNILAFNRKTLQFTNPITLDSGSRIVDVIAVQDQFYYLLRANNDGVYNLNVVVGGVVTTLVSNDTVNFLSSESFFRYGTTYKNKVVYLRSGSQTLVVSDKTVAELYAPDALAFTSLDSCPYLIESLEPGKTLSLQGIDQYSLGVYSLQSNDTKTQTSTWTLVAKVADIPGPSQIQLGVSLVGINSKEYFIYTSSPFAAMPLIVKTSNGVTHAVSSDALVQNGNVYAKYPPSTSTILNVPVQNIHGDASFANVGYAQMMASFEFTSSE